MNRTLTSRNSSGRVTMEMVTKAIERANLHFLASNRDEAMFLAAGILLALDVEEFDIDVEGGIFTSPKVKITVTLNKGEPEQSITISPR